MKVSHWPNPICTRTTLYCPTRPGHRAGATTITHSLEDTVATETAIWRCDHCGTRYTNAQLDKRAGQCVCSSYDLTDDDGAVFEFCVGTELEFGSVEEKVAAFNRAG